MNVYRQNCKRIIGALEALLNHHGVRLAVHFELEGCCQFAASGRQTLDYAVINQQLRRRGIAGELKPEYWRNQWEYVSLFAGQSPLTEANNLHFMLHHLDDILRPFGVSKTVIEPVVWNGDNGKMLAGSTSIQTHETRSVHIPNAIQMNVSLLDESGKNLLPENQLGEWLQYFLLKNSFDNCLLYLPCEAAFERLALTSRYGLSAELCSPSDISGGYRGSVALYKDKGKHNQLLGIKALVIDAFDNVLSSEQAWHQQTRVEHRLGAASRLYCPYINVIFAYLCALEALAARGNITVEGVQLAPDWQPQQLPESLPEAMAIFEQSHWFEQQLQQALDHYNQLVTAHDGDDRSDSLTAKAQLSCGELKQAFIKRLKTKTLA